MYEVRENPRDVELVKNGWTTNLVVLVQRKGKLETRASHRARSKKVSVNVGWALPTVGFTHRGQLLSIDLQIF